MSFLMVRIVGISAPGTGALDASSGTPDAGYMGLPSGSNIIVSYRIGDAAGKWEVGYGSVSGTILTRLRVRATHADGIPNAALNPSNFVNFDAAVHVELIAEMCALVANYPDDNDYAPSVNALKTVAIGAGAAAGAGSASGGYNQDNVAILGTAYWGGTLAVGRYATDYGLGTGGFVRALNEQHAAVEFLGAITLTLAVTAPAGGVNGVGPSLWLPGVVRYEAEIVSVRESDYAIKVTRFDGVLKHDGSNWSFAVQNTTDVHTDGVVTVGHALAISGSQLNPNVTGVAGQTWHSTSRVRLLMQQAFV